MKILLANLFARLAISKESNNKKVLGSGTRQFIEIGFYADISWESRCNIEINV
jgi:hypothetical protein